MLHFDRKELDRILQPENYSPTALVELFEKSFSHEYASGVGVWEGYTLKDHTLMVLRQFEKYFSNRRLPGGVDIDFLRVVLALHDIGKPRAVRQGDKKLQHRQTKSLIKSVLETLNFKDKDISIAIALVSKDPIGDYIKHGTLDKSVREIIEGVKLAGFSTEEFFKLLTIYYQVDAGSYTEDARGLKSLDYLFKFNSAKRTMDFSPRVKRKVSVLKKRIKEIS